MANILIINGHIPYAFSEGNLNIAYVDRAKAFFESQGDVVRVTNVAKGYDMEAEADNHAWADTIIIQYAVYWMSTPWVLKKYIDEVFTAGLDGRICHTDGRTSAAPKKNYGTGGALHGKNYMLSVTYNAPKEAFNDPLEPFMKGRSVDDMLYPTHLAYQFCAASPLPTFAAHDVVKNPEIESDFARFDEHLKATFAKTPEAA